MAIRNYGQKQMATNDMLYNPSAYADPNELAYAANQPPPQTYGSSNAAPAPPRTTAPTFQPNTQTSDINRQWRDNRTAAIDQGNVLQNDLSAEQNYRSDLENRYRTGAGMSSPGMETAYSDLYNTPGYTADEAAGITRENQFNNLITPQSEYDKLNATPEEKAGMLGNVGSYGQYFDPSLQRQIDTNAANMQRRQVQTAAERVGGALEQQKADYNAAIDPSKLGLSSDYYANTSGALNRGTADIRSTVDPTKLRYSQDVANNARFTDQDVRDWEAQAGNTVRNRYASAKSDLTRAAAASGNADALAIGAGRARLENQEAVGSADALTNARIQARQAQTQREMDLEQARIAAEQGYSGLASSNEQQIAGRTLGQANTNEQMRLGAEQDISNRRMNAADITGTNTLSAYKYLGDLGASTEANIGSAERGTQQNITSTGTAINQAADVNSANRWQQYYQNRNANQQYQIGSQFNQGFGVNRQLADANTNVANARIGGQQEYRGWATGQTGAAQQGSQTAQGNRIAAYGAQTGATQGATQGLSNWEIGNQGNTVLNKSLKTIATLRG